MPTAAVIYIKMNAVIITMLTQCMRYEWLNARILQVLGVSLNGTWASPCVTTTIYV